MQNYIGTKLVKAEPETREGSEGYKEGYKIFYEDGYTSWSPKAMFEKHYLPIIENKNMKSKIAISPEMVKKFISITEVSTIGEKTTLVRAILVNGFEIAESSGCVDKENYSQEMGEKVCMKKIEDKIWMLLGFLLQTAFMGV